ncbi:hypothetical protein LCGC14_0580120 [marine sediment metagenome]|uniref:Uncharacterized protein n=1 Tax=marine sediment metagenome TaxID=412755 RepID=A0A0F9RGS9_9ZZZZ
MTDLEKQQRIEARASEKIADFSKPIQRITRRKLVMLLLEQEARGANFVQVFSRTVPAMRKTENEFFGLVEKVAEKNCQINWFYKNAVQNQRTREDVFDDFTPHPRTWGTMMFNPILQKTSKTLLDHTNKKTKVYCQYVQMRTLKTENTHYEWLETGVKLTNKEVAELKTFFPPYRKSQTQRTEKEIIVNDYKIQSIEMLSMNNVLYVVIGD